MGHTQLLCAVDFALGPSFEIVIAGRPESSDTRAMLDALRGRFVPNKVVLLRAADEAGGLAKLAPFVGPMGAVDGRATAYVCTDYNCKQPTTDPAKMLELIGAGEPK
jgi:uncharacterized protein YyaL (SSP411 family)